MTGALLGVLALILLASTGLFTALLLGVRGASLLLATYVAGFGAAVGLFLFLSAFDAARRGVLLAGLIALAGAAASCWFLAGAPRTPLPRLAILRGRRRGPLLFLALAVALGLAYVIALIVGTPPNGWDPLNYHLARAAFWTQSGGIAYIDGAYDERLNFNPPHGEIAFALDLDITREENLVGFVQFLAAIACAIAIFALARAFRLSRAEAAFGALLFASLPIVVLQSSGAKNDVIVASFLLASTVFVLSERSGQIALAGLATALAVGTKFTAAFGLVVLLPLAILALPHARRLARTASLVVGAAVGSYWYAVNAHETDHLLGDQSNVPGLTAPFHLRENVLTAYGALVDTFDVSGAPAADVFIYAIAAVALAVTLSIASRTRAGRHTALLAAALVATPLLLVVLSEEVGRPGLLRLYHALGEPKGYLADGDAIASAPTTASDTGSWFGPVGFLLVLATGVSVVVLARRREMSRVALVVGLAPVLWFVLVAVTLTYNPWLGRFFIYPVGLSAALWGLTLRRPALAWGVATLAAVTLGLSLVHYVEKPSGLRLLDRADTPSVWQQKRWEVQSQHDPAIAPVFRFLDTAVPVKTTIALALSANDFGYPAFGPHVERHVDLVPFGSTGREARDDWLLASSERSGELDAACWRAAYAGSTGAVFRRRPECGG